MESIHTGSDGMECLPSGGVYLPRSISYYCLNKDNTYSQCSEQPCSVFIRDTQFAKLWVDGTIQHIRETYGEVIGVMHFATDYIGVPIYNTMKYVLGG